jgi:hypothetical protein
MDLLDLLRALPGLLLLGLVPGLAALALLRPSMPGWWRLAAAPGVSIGMVGVLGLVYHRGSVPFELASVLPPIAALTLAAVLARARHRAVPADPQPPLRSRPGRIVLAGAVAAGLLSASLAVVTFRLHPLPPETDNPIHAYVTASIARQHDVIVAQPVPIAGTASVRERVAFEATAAEVASLTGMRPEAAMLPLVLLCVLLLPLSLAVLTLEATGSWRMAAVVPLLGVGFTLIPWALEYGEFPYLADATLVVPLALSARRALFGIERRREVALVGVFVAAMWATHGLEFATAVVIGAPFALASVRGRSLRTLASGAAGVAGAVLVGVLLVTVLSRLPALPPTRPPAGISASTQAAQMLAQMGTRSQMPHALADFVRSELVTPAIVLYVLGIAGALLVRGMRWALAVHVVLLLVLADVSYGGILMRLWTPLFPWSGADRIVSIQWFVVPLLMAWGLFHVVDVVRPGLTRLLRNPRNAAAIAGVAGAVAVLTVAVASRQTLVDMRTAVDSGARSTDADVAALTDMDRMLPPGSLVLTQGPVDAGQWTDVLTRDVEWAPLQYERNFVRTGTILPAADPRDAALHQACYDTAAARQALQGIGAVFVGSLPNRRAGEPWDASCIAALPGVREAADVTVGGRTARVFIVADSGPTASR